MFKHLRSFFLTGLFILLPLVVSLEVLFWGFQKADAILGNLFFKYFGLQITGLGLVSLLILITFTGIIARHYLGRKLITMAERVLHKIPILNAIYGTTKQISESFTSKDKSAFRKVVLIEYPRKGVYSPGFLTGDSPSEACARTGRELVNVFIPTVPPTTGVLIFVPLADVIILNMPVEDGFKIFISAGAIKPS